MKTTENHKMFRSDPYVIFSPPKKKIRRELRTISYCSSFDLFINETSGKAILFFLSKIGDEIRKLSIAKANQSISILFCIIFMRLMR